MSASDLRPILHVIPTLGRGGAERQLVRLIRAVDHDRWPQVVCQLGGPQDLADDVRGAGADLVDLQLESRRPWIRSGVGVDRVIRRHRPAVVVSWLFDAALASFLAGVGERGLGRVVTLHNTDYEPEAVDGGAILHAKVRALLALDRAQARWSRATFVAVSEAVARSAGRHLRIPTERLKVMPNCVDPDDLDVAAGEPLSWRSSLGIPPEATVVLSVGRLHRQKGYLSLIDAFAEVAATRPDAHLVLVGRGPQQDELADRARMVGADDRVHLPGTMTRIGVAYAAADAFVFPSLYEGFGIALAEAMWSGLPAVVSKIPVLEELVDDGVTGLLVSPGSHQSLVAALATLLDDGALRGRLGQAGAVAARRFSPEAIAPQWHELWRSLSARQPRLSTAARSAHDSG